MKPVRVANLKDVESEKPSEWLANPDNTRDAIMECFLDNDFDALKEILKAHYEAIEYQAAIEKAKVPRRTFHHALSKAGNPTARNLVSLIHGALRPA